MARLKPCMGLCCNQLIPQETKGGYCDKCKPKRNKEYRREDTQKIYDNKRWKKVRDSVRKSNPFCEVCMELGIRGIPAIEVHHIIKVTEGNDETHYNPNNLLCLCDKHHRMIEGMSKEELIKALQNGSLR